jgi:hypothetical protein
MLRLFRKTPPNPFAVVQGVFDALEQQAEARNDMRALGKLRAARSTVTTEALRGAK